MKNRLLFGLGGAVVGGAFALFIYTGGAYKRDALACSTEFNFTRNQGKANEVKVNAVAQFYFHRDGTGVTTYKGAARAGGICCAQGAAVECQFMKKILIANRAVHAAGMVKQVARARAACRPAMEPRGLSV